MSAITAIASHLAHATQSNPSLEKAQALDLAESGGAGKESFTSMLNNQINSVNDMLSTADKKVTEMAMGKTENLHDAMISVEKAESSFKFLVQLRNKAIEAYNEIIRMQV